MNNNFNYWFAGVGISFNLDALFKSKKELKQARIATSKAEKNYQLVKEEIENKVHEAYVNLNEAYVRLHTQQKSVQLAHENFRIVRQRYLNGLSLITDMLDASNMQLDMELQLANYQIGILYQYYLLKKITGHFNEMHIYTKTKKYMMRNKKRAISNFFILLVLVAGISWVCGKFIHLGNVEYTDNAQVKQHLTPVSTRVQGFIKKICFEEYQTVKKGDTLAIIEDTEYRLKVAQAEADYRNALAGKSAMHTTINTTQNNILVTDAAIDEQRIRLQNAQTDYKRYQELLKEEAVTPQQFDRVKTDYEATQARYEQLLRQKQSTLLQKQEQTQRLEQNESAIKLAEAALTLAKLNLSYTVILATTDGVTGRKNIHEGELVQPGQALVTLVDGTEKWVIDNYKETQTTDMKRNQLVEVRVDAIPDVKFEGRIASISDATGASYSLIPQNNSAGNFVKVEQRIPVRIEFTENNRPEDLQRLRAGMNVECYVKQ